GNVKMPPIEEKDIFKSVLVDIVANSINYCYWYGRSDVRPGNSSSTSMYENLSNAFFDYDQSFQRCLDAFINLITINRFPLLEQRIKHLQELPKKAEDFAILVVESDKHNEETFDFLFDELISLFPGYASDMFLKRASLFFIQLYRRFGWYSDILRKVHIPADYQVPKLFEYFGCIEYSDCLTEKILKNIHIPKWSEEECEIRSATVLTARELLCNLTDWNVADVDSWFFMRRNGVTRPFHLTITTDY
ncbi:MAG: queuosine salvage family protein, partial [Candidatus Heimdallarchaeaceae archaeon]